MVIKMEIVITKLEVQYGGKLLINAVITEPTAKINPEVEKAIENLHLGFAELTQED